MGLPENRNFFIEPMTQNSDVCMPNSHIHDYYEIYYLVEGQRRYLVNHTLYDLLPYDVMLVSKGDIHITQQLGDNPKYSRYLITFNDAFLETISDAFDTELLMRPFETKKIHIPESMHNSFNMLMHKGTLKNDPGDKLSQYTIKVSIIELLINLNKCTSNSISPLMDSITVYEDRIQEVCRYICNFYNQPITLDQMAKIAYMSPTYFSRKFKSVTGFGFKEYLNHIRIKMATNLLMESQYSITEIASYCGYHDSNYFGDVFKRIVGSSPNRYRKEHYIL